VGLKVGRADYTPPTIQNYNRTNRSNSSIKLAEESRAGVNGKTLETKEIAADVRLTGVVYFVRLRTAYSCSALRSLCAAVKKLFGEPKLFAPFAVKKTLTAKGAKRAAKHAESWFKRRWP
jgi:hypothetical protein